MNVATLQELQVGGYTSTKNTIEKKREMKREELLNQVAEKLERCEYTPMVTTKEELPIWTMLLNKVYEETFKTKRDEGFETTIQNYY